MTRGVMIVKHNGKRPSEWFNPDKLHASIQAACLSVRSLEGEAEMTAFHTTDHVLSWIAQKSEITSSDVRRVAAEALEILHPEAAYLYKHHELVL